MSSTHEQEGTRLELLTAPFLHDGLSTRRLMFEVLATLVPIVAASAWFFGISALLVITSATLGAVVTEWFFTRGSGWAKSLVDGSGLLTGILLGLTLPPAMPLWMAFLGGVAGIGLGKVIWGGLGQNLFNPALVGRAFLQAAFPTVITTWSAPGRGFFEIAPSTFAPPLMRASVDVVTQATPLGLAKFDGQVTEIAPLIMGRTAGSIGETMGLLLLSCGIFLAARKVFDWRLPVSTLLTVVSCGGILHLFDPENVPHPGFMIFSGGLLFGAIYMVTDPVTTPITPRGAWIFGIGVGVLVVLIRLYGGLPEGVMYAILLMNSVTPLINRYTQPRIFGG